MRIDAGRTGAYLLGLSVGGFPYAPAWLLILAVVAGVALIEWDEARG
ncbi:hypothetical protein SEA_DARDANUS_70 [Gordonia phage Dardanus]|uniref:Uncharacterized protein n=1 Tax=Gordonia phage Dardanus TaxID=2588489 RepID=A0A514CX56_9CAUD|nr:hypothetical protein KDJ58_gp70 [Gordonia phage Dardanus]QDH85107.1 hypothetical protein SEA_DARDANUS_70 [Gordonia phage Dardanus]